MVDIVHAQSQHVCMLTSATKHHCAYEQPHRATNTTLHFVNALSERFVVDKSNSCLQELLLYCLSFWAAFIYQD